MKEYKQTEYSPVTGFVTAHLYHWSTLLHVSKFAVRIYGGSTCYTVTVNGCDTVGTSLHNHFVIILLQSSFTVLII